MKHKIRFNKATAVVKAETGLTKLKNEVTERIKTPKIRMLVEEKCPPNFKIGKALKESAIVSNDPKNLTGEWVFELIDLSPPKKKAAAPKAAAKLTNKANTSESSIPKWKKTARSPDPVLSKKTSKKSHKKTAQTKTNK